MKFECAADDLAVALDRVALGLLDRIKAPALSAIKIEVGDDAVALTSNVMNHRITVTSPAKVIEPGVAAPPGDSSRHSSPT